MKALLLERQRAGIGEALDERRGTLRIEIAVEEIGRFDYDLLRQARVNAPQLLVDGLSRLRWLSSECQGGRPDDQ